MPRQSKERALKLVIFDQNARLYEDELKAGLERPWQIVRGPYDIQWLGCELPDADAAIGLRLPAELLSQAPRLKLFLFPGAGVMHEQSHELPEGCRLCNVYEHEKPIAEYVFLALLYLVTGVRQVSDPFAQGNWLGNGRIGGEPHGELFGGVLGIVGYGHIGVEVARRAAAFGLRVQAIRLRPERTCEDPAVDVLGGPDALERLLATSDYVVIACPLTAQTRGWIGREHLRRLRPHALLVNVARAEIVDETALFEALRDRWFAGAALDAWYQYPIDASQRVHGSHLPFHQLPNVLATPHFSAWTNVMIVRRARQMANNLNRFARGEEPERVVLVGSWRPS